MEASELRALLDLTEEICGHGADFEKRRVGRSRSNEGRKRYGGIHV